MPPRTRGYHQGAKASPWGDNYVTAPPSTKKLRLALKVRPELRPEPRLGLRLTEAPRLTEALSSPMLWRYKEV